MQVARCPSSSSMAASVVREHTAVSPRGVPFAPYIRDFLIAVQCRYAHLKHSNVWLTPRFMKENGVTFVVPSPLGIPVDGQWSKRAPSIEQPSVNPAISICGGSSSGSPADGAGDVFILPKAASLIDNHPTLTMSVAGVTRYSDSLTLYNASETNWGSQQLLANGNINIDGNELQPQLSDDVSLTHILPLRSLVQAMWSPYVANQVRRLASDAVLRDSHAIWLTPTQSEYFMDISWNEEELNAARHLGLCVDVFLSSCSFKPVSLLCASSTAVSSLSQMSSTTANTTTSSAVIRKLRCIDTIASMTTTALLPHISITSFQNVYGAQYATTTSCVLWRHLFRTLCPQLGEVNGWPYTTEGGGISRPSCDTPLWNKKVADRLASIGASPRLALAAHRWATTGALESCGASPCSGIRPAEIVVERSRIVLWNLALTDILDQPYPEYHPLLVRQSPSGTSLRMEPDMASHGTDVLSATFTGSMESLFEGQELY